MPHRILLAVALLFLSVPALSLLLPEQANAQTCVARPCPEGQSLNEQCDCEPDNPAPEMSVMMLPVALGAAGYFAVRSRKKAQKKSS